jgi:hypothetical protein
MTLIRPLAQARENNDACKWFLSQQFADVFKLYVISDAFVER